MARIACRSCALLLVLLLCAQLPPHSADASSLIARTDAADVIPGRIIIELRAGATIQPSSIGARLRQAGDRSIRSVTPIAGRLVVLDVDSSHADRLIAQFAADPAVAYAEPDYRLHIKRTPNDPMYSEQWALPKIEAPAAWDTTTGAPSVVVAVVDTGVDAQHPDLVGRVLPGYDFVNNDPDAADDNGHGTYTAGIIAAAGDNGVGVAGICWACRILPIKAMNAEGDGSSASVAQGIRWAVDHGAQIISLSIGSEHNPKIIRDAVAYAESKGVLIVAAAGNEAGAGNPIEYPAAYESVLAVAATDASDAHAPFSNFGPQVDIAAPGIGIKSTSWSPDNPAAYVLDNGTSAATPIVAGAAALLLSVDPSLHADQLREILMSTADDLGVPGRDDYFGAGRLNAARAVDTASARVTAATAPITFPETGKTLRGEFRRFWEQNGGLPVFGFPITEEAQEQTPEGTFTAQYFERNRFEFHPENPAPYNVLLGRLGDAVLRLKGIDWQTEPAAEPKAGCRFFPQTGHNVCEPFLSYWNEHGLNDRRLSADGRSLALFGLPLGEAHVETNSSGDTVLTQWFERARFEDHGPQGVLLGLLGDELRQPDGP